MSYSDEELLTHIRELAAELGEAPTMNQMSAADGRPSGSTYRHRFGSWPDAVQQAGVEPADQPSPYTKTELLEHIRALATELGRPPTLEDLNADDDRPSFKPYRRVFDTWNAALTAAGFDPNHAMSHTEPEGYSDAELLTHIQELAEELGRPPTQNEMHQADNRPSESTYKRRFESWTNAIEEAGFDSGRKTSSYSEAELLDLLRDLATELGETPSVQQLNAAEDYPSRAVYRNRFGSWSAALEAANLE